LRKPDRRVMEHRELINVTALAFIALGALTAFDYRYRTAGLITLSTTLIAWIILRSRIRPRVSDYLDHLRLAAEKDGFEVWLSSADAAFVEEWGLTHLEELDDG
jgi:hypothetical protein